MQQILKKLAVLVGVIVVADLVIPGVSSDEIALQAGLIALFGGTMLFRQ